MCVNNSIMVETGYKVKSYFGLPSMSVVLPVENDKTHTNYLHPATAHKTDEMVDPLKKGN